MSNMKNFRQNSHLSVIFFIFIITDKILTERHYMSNMKNFRLHSHLGVIFFIFIITDKILTEPHYMSNMKRVMRHINCLPRFVTLFSWWGPCYPF